MSSTLRNIRLAQNMPLLAYFADTLVTRKEGGFLTFYGSFTIESKFGRVSSEFAYDEVSCSGNEKRLHDCKHDDEEDCAEKEAAGVVCQT